MKVAFDATVVHGRKSGVGYYTQELFRALLRLRQADDYFVFSHRPVSSSLVASTDRVRFSGGRFCPVRAFYLHALLPGLLNQAKPDLVHYTNFLAPITESHPYLLTVHDMSLERLTRHHPIGKRVYTKRLIPYAARRASLILTNSEFSKWDIVRFLGIPEDRIRVTPLAASHIFRPTTREERLGFLRPHDLDRPYFLYLGNIEPRKNLDRLLEAFASIPSSDQILVIAGNAWFRGKRVFRKAAELKLGARVRFLDYLPRRELPALIGGATAFVYPSLLEGFGLPVLEAMACGKPVITSSTSSLEEIAGGAAMLVDPKRTDKIAEALVAVAEDRALREDLSAKSLKRAAEFSWHRTAELTRAAYREVFEDRVGERVSVPRSPVSRQKLQRAVRETLDYALQFDYPLTVSELRERLFGVRAESGELVAALESAGIEPLNGYVPGDRRLVDMRQERELWSDHVIREFWPRMEILARLPFVRMLAFSGATAHRNMRDRDVDLFAVIEDGKLWSTLLIVTVWAKLRGIRDNICLNYLVSDRALPLFETDPFTAQQVASLKPFYGKNVYDTFIGVNPFVRGRFPNFDPLKHRSVYDEISESWSKLFLERLLRAGPIQLFEIASRWVLGSYLERKGRRAVVDGEPDVIFEKQRIKLHLKSHKGTVLREIGKNPDASLIGNRIHSSFAPSSDQSPEQNVEVQSQ